MLDAGYPFGAEFVIIVPDEEDFIDAAEVIKDLRQEEGIITEIFTLSEIGSTFEEIEYWIDYAYYTWSIPPEAILLLADCKDNNFTEGIPSREIEIFMNHGFFTFPTDNYYADVDGDHLPDIAVGRIPARNEDDLDNIIGKLLQLELDPTINSSFYQNVLVSGCFQYDKNFDFHTLSEIIKGFYKFELSKNLTRLYLDHINTPITHDQLEVGDRWMPKNHSINLPGMISYFASYNYITDSITTDFIDDSIWYKSADDIRNVIEAGCFIVYNIGHGGVDDVYRFRWKLTKLGV
ncbi:MAG: hypothetical protein APR63_13305 [Desulfuromonas sp. SDB]|nr:MAG: hypothetical protein APR63_13305 [Desulfuromonas sp. SDB]